MRHFLTLTLIVLISSCSLIETEENLVEPEVQRFELVDQQLISHFLAFEAAAKERGLTVDLSEAGIIGNIEEIHQENVAGQCSFSSNRPNEITIDLEFWNRASDNFREYIVFHEIGHCYLNRGHSEGILNNGACASIMRSGTGNCRDNYTSATRSFYLDELFQVLQ